MSDPLIRAEAQIRANPRERAAYELGKAEGFEDGWYAGYDEWNGAAPDVDEVPRANAAAAYLLLAEVPTVDPTREYTTEEMDELDAWAVREHIALNHRQADIQRAVGALRWARKVREDASMHTYDAAEAQVQAAARVLAGMREVSNG